MYYKNYEDYMRSVLGYSSENPNTYQTYQYINYSDDIISLYPEIYKLIDPMVCKFCNENTEPITRELIDKTADKIIDNLDEETSRQKKPNNNNIRDLIKILILNQLLGGNYPIRPQYPPVRPPYPRTNNYYSSNF